MSRERIKKRKRKHLNKKKGLMDKLPFLNRIKKRAEVRSRGKEILEEADKVYVPEKAKENAKRTKEIQGKTRIHEIEKNGKKIAIVIPRFKEEYSLYREKDKAIGDFRKMKDRRFPNEKDFKKAIEEGEIGRAHTHPKEGPKPSDIDRINLKTIGGSSSLVVSNKGCEVAYRGKKGEVKEKEAEYISKEKLGELMEEVVEERVKRKKKPKFRKKAEKKK